MLFGVTINSVLCVVMMNGVVFCFTISSVLFGVMIIGVLFDVTINGVLLVLRSVAWCLLLR